MAFRKERIGKNHGKTNENNKKGKAIWQQGCADAESKQFFYNMNYCFLFDFIIKCLYGISIRNTFCGLYWHDICFSSDYCVNKLDWIYQNAFWRQP